MPRQLRRCGNSLTGSEFLFHFRLSGFGDFVRLCGLVLEKAERGIALAKDATLQQTAEALGQFKSAAMLGDDQTALTEKWGRAEKPEDTCVLVSLGVGRVDKNEIEG